MYSSIFFVLSALITNVATATATEPSGCEKLLSTLAQDLIENHLDETVSRLIRVHVASENKRSVIHELSIVVRKFNVRISVSDEDIDTLGTTVEFTMNGFGRDVVQAALELGRRNSVVAGARITWTNAGVERNDPEDDSLTESQRQDLRMPLRELRLSRYVLNRLREAGLDFVGDLVSRGLIVRAGFGTSRQHEIFEALFRMNLSVGMLVPGWPFANLDPNPWDQPSVTTSTGEVLVKDHLRPGEMISRLTGEALAQTLIMEIKPYRREISERLSAILDRLNVTRFEDIVHVTDDQFLREPGAGEAVHAELRMFLARFRLTLGIPRA